MLPEYEEAFNLLLIIDYIITSPKKITRGKNKPGNIWLGK